MFGYSAVSLQRQDIFATRRRISFTRNSLDSIESDERKRQDPADDGVEFVTFVTFIAGVFIINEL